MWTCLKALILTLSNVMINCNCFNDWDYSLLAYNEVSDSYFTLWIDCYFSIRNHMTIYIYIYVAILRMIMMTSYPYFILSTPLSLNMWTYLSISASASEQARSNFGGVDTSIFHHALYGYLMHYGLSLHIISQYLYLFSLILQGLHEEGWYVTNVSIIFDCSMLYYVLFWTLLGFIIHFYIIFGTNPLTGGPSQNCCFCLF